METKAHLFFQAEENIDLSDKGSNSFTTILPSRNTENKKYIKFSKTIEKENSSEIKDLCPDYKKKYEASVFICREEKFSEFSGERKVRRKKSLQVHLHSKRTEVAPPTLRLPKEMASKENILCKLPNQYNVHKTSLPLYTSSSVFQYLNHCILFLEY
ncbi:EF-hand calcium-binding domain-containing protein 13 [Erethizon dorsatum]